MQVGTFLQLLFCFVSCSQVQKSKQNDIRIICHDHCQIYEIVVMFGLKKSAGFFPIKIWVFSLQCKVLMYSQNFQKYFQKKRIFWQTFFERVCKFKDLKKRFQTEHSDDFPAIKDNNLCTDAIAYGGSTKTLFLLVLELSGEKVRK